jgi:hypothetical protein
MCIHFIEDLFGITARKREEQARLEQAKQAAQLPADAEAERQASEARMRKLASSRGVGSTLNQVGGAGAPVSVRMLLGQ